MDVTTLSQYLSYPIQEAPEGVVSNFVNPASNAYQIYVTAGVCVPLMLIFAAFRWACKRFYQESKIVHELVFVAGLIFNVGFSAITIICVSGGVFGHHAWDVRFGDFTKRQLVLVLSVEVILPITVCLVKVSVLLLYLQIFWVIYWLRITSITSTALIVIFHLGLSMSFAVLCSPSTGSGQLDFLAAFISVKCSQTRVLVLLQGVGNVLTDLLLMIMPLPHIWRLNMPLKKKLAVCSMFLVGVIALGASVTGLVFRVQFYTNGSDSIHFVVGLWVTVMIEQAAGIIICCMPMTATVFRQAKHPIFSLSLFSFRNFHMAKGSSLANERNKNKEQSKSSEFLANHESNFPMQLQDLNTQILSEAAYDPISPQESHKTWINAHQEVDSKHFLFPEVSRGESADQSKSKGYCL